MPFIVDKQVVAVGDGVVECEAAAMMLRCALVAGNASWRPSACTLMSRNKAEATETSVAGAFSVKT